MRKIFQFYTCHICIHRELLTLISHSFSSNICPKTESYSFALFVRNVKQIRSVQMVRCDLLMMVMNIYSINAPKMSFMLTLFHFDNCIRSRIDYNLLLAEIGTNRMRISSDLQIFIQNWIRYIHYDYKYTAYMRFRQFNAKLPANSLKNSVQKIHFESE